jgi:hypothetical protein
MQRNLADTPENPSAFWRGAVIWGYLGLANRLNGCGGLQHTEAARPAVQVHFAGQQGVQRAFSMT